MSSPVGNAKKTPLYAQHVALGAKVIDFGGWLMPVQYPTGILEEHKAVRTACGLFDVSHMGEILFTGPRAAEAVQRITTNDVSKLVDNGAQYTTTCKESGGVVDDCIVYRFGAERFLIIVNASNIEKDFRHFTEHAGSLCTIEDVSDEYGLLAVQGPKAIALVKSLTDGRIPEKPFTTCASYFPELDAEVTLARTGYTGEDGVEILVAEHLAPSLWDLLLQEGGESHGIKPIGLGARDTLRLEARLCLYGNDLDEEHTPHEAGLSWVVKGKGFVGEEALAKEKAAGVGRKLIGFKVIGRGIARHGYDILDATGKIGVVTSGTVAPTVGGAIGMGYVPADKSAPGTKLIADCRGKPADIEIVQGPFYRRAATQA